VGRLAVRNAVTKAVGTAAITYVGTVFPARPTIVQEQDYQQTMQGASVPSSPNGSNAVIVVNITSDKRTRDRLTGRGAVGDFNVHQMALEVWFASNKGTGTAAQKDYDAVIDGLFVFIRNHATMTDATVVWSAGEYRAGVAHEQSEAFTTATGLVVWIFGLVRFEAWETITGSTV